jgi:hypothetical protein
MTTTDLSAIPDELLHALADDAFAVLNWAKRMGFPKQQQIDETVKAFKKRLAETEVHPDPQLLAVTGGHRSTPSYDALTAQNDDTSHGVVGQGGLRQPGHRSSNRNDSSAAEPWTGNEPGYVEAASADKSTVPA